MRIIVCVKQVPDMTDAKMDRKANTIIRHGTSSIINPYDIHAVEEAIRISQHSCGIVTALSMGLYTAVDMLRNLIAMGVHEGVLLTDRAFAGSDTLATCYTLSKAIEKIKEYDLVLCGKQTVDGDTAQVGPGLAEKLKIPHVTNVVKIHKITPGKVLCQRKVDNGYELIRIPIPAVITVDKGINIPRFPDIKGIRAMKTAGINIWNAEDIGCEHDRIGIKGSPTQVVKTFIPASKAASEVIGGTAVEQVSKIIDIFDEMHIRV